MPKKNSLLIVESPSKIKTIKKHLGPGFEVLASNGHIRDLQKSKLSVDVDNNFQPTYVEMENKKEVLDKLRKAASSADKVYLATDPDREGEAISWHLAELLALNIKDKNRVTFNEITKTGVQNGMAAPRSVDMDLVDAQQARRIFDRLVGYKISPFLWKKIKRGLSAGRVQSVAVRIIVDRENEIRAFNPVEYWSLDAMLLKTGHKEFESKFSGILESGKVKKLDIGNEADAKGIASELQSAEYSVYKVKTGVKTRQPAPPFITSTMQQDASRKFGFTADRTMKTAQQLYEGVEVENLGTTGLITYMRTDSLRISDEARTEGNRFIETAYGKNYLPEQPRFFKSKSSAQDAHEAIRPTMPTLTPDSIKATLTADQYKLYKLVWERFMASLMAAQILDTVSADILAKCGKDYMMKSSGFTVKFDGFTVLYEESKDEADEDNTALPPLFDGDKLALKSLVPNQHFTQPPPRYTEASLIKALEENGIGRPSTYAPTITTVLAREYVERDKKQLKPTPLGEVTTGLMKDHFADIVNVEFTANMEENLDKVEQGDLVWTSAVGGFYDSLSKTLKAAEENMDGVRIKVPDIESDVICDLCGKTMVIKSGRFGKFLACPGYPECKNTKPIVKEMPGECPKCGGKILLKKSKNGNKYYGCEKFPTCDFMTWDDPTADLCPQCGKTIFKRRGGLLVCLKEGCGYEAKAERKPRKGSKAAAEAAEVNVDIAEQTDA